MRNHPQNTASFYNSFGSSMVGYKNSDFNYAFDFNGKETDSETGLQDYGFRIYNKAYGRFLSVDPLSRDYPWNSTYAFAENRVIDGIDLEGLEYLSANASRINVNNGRVELKVENFNFISRRLFLSANNNPKNWKPGEIGINKQISSIRFVKITPKFEPLALNSNTASPVNDESVVKVGTNNAASTGRPDQRFKERTIVGPSPNRASAAKASLIVYGVMATIEWSFFGAGMYEESIVNEHLSILDKVTNDVLTALELGMIPEKYQNISDISAIINVVLQGESGSDNKELFDIGMQIYNEISKPNKPILVKTPSSSTTDNTSVNTPQYITPLPSTTTPEPSQSTQPPIPSKK